MKRRERFSTRWPLARASSPMPWTPAYATPDELAHYMGEAVATDTAE